MLDGIEKTSIETIELINDIKDLMEVLFTHPYTKIEFLVENLDMTRQTAIKYLKNY
jgi:hypothetical protein